MEAASSSIPDEDMEVETPIREKLSHMSLEDLQQLKEKLGTKIFDETMFGTQRPKKKLAHKYEDEVKKEHIGRRIRENQPLEMSSKIQPRCVLPEVKRKKKPQCIDPRFDPLFGKFDPQEFKSNYSFINKAKEKDIAFLKAQLAEETDGKEKKKLDYAYKKLENELREQKRLEIKKKKDEERHRQNIRDLERGIKPSYLNKTDVRAMEIIEKYERVKQQGTILKSIAKHRQKVASRNRKKFDSKGLGRQ